MLSYTHIQDCFVELGCENNMLIINHIKYFRIYLRYLLLFSEWKFVVMYVMLKDIDARVALIVLLVSQRCS